ncbi:MAG: peptidoglycan editing factor PgeF [Cyanobacteriota bacterium]|nr:peptidoglycan editing factor PgeF [Cyanobacteriota bacterium]
MWQWQSWEGRPYLTCRLLEEWRHGFFTQHFESRSPERLVAALHPEAAVYRVKQVHGDRVMTPSEIEAEILNGLQDTPWPQADGVLTELAQQSVWVASADCTPALIADRATGRVAAVHAGWRGTAKEIVPEAIARFLERGSKPKNLRIALGPAISGAVYQVSRNVAAEVGQTLMARDRAFSPEQILERLFQLNDPPIQSDPQPGRVRLDVRRVNVLQLERLGIDPEQIAIAPYCTYQQPEYFFSYRRTREKKVQWSGIVSQQTPVRG